MSDRMLRVLIRNLIVEQLKVIDKDKRWGTPTITYQMPLKKDRFIHFTAEARARQILDDGVLSMNPPYKKFGTDTVDAVSVKRNRNVRLLNPKVVSLEKGQNMLRRTPMRRPDDEDFVVKYKK